MNSQLLIARWAHLLSAGWVFLLALLIIADVLGRTLFLHPIAGTKEILQNSVIAVTFLQLPLAIYSGSMLRTTLLQDHLGPTGTRALRLLAWLLGALLFAGIAYACWPAALDAVRLGEYEGEGAMRIYTWPVRFLLVATCLFAAIAYVSMLIADLRGKLEADGRTLIRPIPKAPDGADNT
ncbi:TRAP-type C4-dicarboxylate transport system, small permease component [Thalassovita gelatinovora]|uniref:TRAP transporter small permease protein n=1 Tax=Thalassovita gelatinovora TaxID=53501 RepID=A0A0N7LW42_THAGE|nr:TRAP transporter small permease [Thalassovita gelatinovora]QIZ81602.1 TRAP transporter small permease [Thalassovita gelatinovora]CUH68050.1 TRAP-type C4-dicarboxylate transport system, small permease component [Thalassovita gelatinovora]SEQ28274.1 TRAP-type C4-dicarboxylate transport system, small permease component [Thalassovita gelatinovora]